MNANDMIAEAKDKFSTNNYFEVEVLCKRILIADSKNTQALALMGKLALTVGKNTTAIDLFDKYFDAMSSNLGKITPEVLIDIAKACSTRPNNRKANSLYAKALNEKPESLNLKETYTRHKLVKKLNSPANNLNQFLPLSPAKKEYTFTMALNDEDLIYASPTLRSVVLLLTSKCNLRCVYCPQHWSGDSGVDANNEVLKNVTDYIIKTDVKETDLSAYGEVLIYKDWPQYASKLLDHGVKLSIVSNLSMNLSDTEYALLSRFEYIAISVDTTDRNIFKKIRNPGRLELVLFNLQKIRIAALKEGRTPPCMRWQCVLTTSIIPQLTDLIHLATLYDINCIVFNELSYLDDVEIPVDSPFTLEGDAFINAAEHIKGALRLAQKNNIEIVFAVTNWMELFEHKLAIENSKIKYGIDINITKEPVTIQPPIDNIQGTGKFFGHKAICPGPGETRDCLYPWQNIYIFPDGNTYTCCLRGTSMGILDTSTSVEQLMNNHHFINLRSQLLSGEITDPTCARCTLRSIIPVATQRFNVLEALNNNNPNTIDMRSKEGLITFLKKLCPEQDISEHCDSVESLTSFMINYCAGEILKGNDIYTLDYHFFRPRIREKIIELCTDKPIYIWGTGGRFQEVREQFKNMRIIAAFDNSLQKHGTTTKDGIEIISPLEIKSIPRHPIFICSSAKDAITYQIKQIDPEAITIGFERQSSYGTDY